MENPIKATVAGIITKMECGKEWVLLTKRSSEMKLYKDTWCLPGGHIDRNESAEDAIIREIKEETGLSFTGIFFNYFDEIIPNKNIHSAVLVFTGSAIGKLKHDEKEVSACEWIPIEKAMKKKLAFRHEEVLEAYIKMPKQIKNQEAYLTEYVQLRNEILKHIEIRNKILHYSMILFAGFLGLAEFFSANEEYLIILLYYPIIATFLSAHWTHSDLRIHDIAEYIRDNIECHFPGLNWESNLRNTWRNKINSTTFLEISILGFFTISQIVSLFLVLISRLNGEILTISTLIKDEFLVSLFVIDSACIILTGYWLMKRRNKYKK
ncbi:MAG: NUDIX hydrolase [Bacteroidia bacterium]|nr:NUDIX hydrolase [Bacteroidia bacterium]